MATIPGGVRPSGGSQNSAEVENLGRFAVDEHNKKENGVVEFVRVVKAAEQVVAGTLHHLTVEAIDAGKKKLYEAKVWVKPWMNFKELQEFKHAGDADDNSPSFTASDLGVKQGGGRFRKTRDASQGEERRQGREVQGGGAPSERRNFPSEQHGTRSLLKIMLLHSLCYSDSNMRARRVCVSDLF
ncbi:cysteine proteinase inhibitor 6-like isoform X2 [Hibiscus syriacus]|uniref:cysteine proteinase inhibitor 6-like isoform X2 n=1 Tax=Hibiscus syriacus TaxID=106335 RepID=UPI001920FD60|nr:cysteine proteinase inhibitor 6-like isoform X2 [Hibiscus syriacus]